MEARWHVEFTGGSRAIATIDQIDSAYHEAGRDPFVAASILGSTHDTQPAAAPATCAVVPTTTGLSLLQK